MRRTVVSDPVRPGPGCGRHDCRDGGPRRRSAHRSPAWCQRATSSAVPAPTGSPAPTTATSSRVSVGAASSTGCPPATWSAVVPGSTTGRSVSPATVPAGPRRVPNGSRRPPVHTVLPTSSLRRPRRGEPTAQYDSSLGLATAATSARRSDLHGRVDPGAGHGTSIGMPYRRRIDAGGIRGDRRGRDRRARRSCRIDGRGEQDWMIAGEPAQRAATGCSGSAVRLPRQRGGRRSLRPRRADSSAWRPVTS